MKQRKAAKGTCVWTDGPWDLYVKANVLCSDGKVRATSRMTGTADTFFSVPCAVKVRGKTVAGYMTFESDGGAYVFVAYQYGALLPRLYDYD